MDKENLRKRNISLRKTLNQENASKVIVSKILSFEPFLRAKNVLIYHPLKNEISLLGLSSISDKKFFLPRVCSKELEICPFEGGLCKSCFGVMEPECEPVKDISLIDIAFIPALAIDKKLNRLGYGKGCYDRLFSNPDFKALKVAVLNKELCVDFIPVGRFDKKVDFLITD